jgi:hypothetical protein
MNMSPLAPREAPIETRDLLQARFLSRMFAKRVQEQVQARTPAHPPREAHHPHRFALKGGQAMRVAHDHARHTKDVDLDADHDLGLEAVQRDVRRAIKEATAGGWLENVVVTEPKQTHTTARWKIQGQLPGSRLAMHLTVEVSFRHHITDDEVVGIPYPVGPGEASIIPVYRDEVLALNKMEALLCPNRDAPRDVVDLFLIFRGGLSLPVESLSARFGATVPVATLIDTLWKKLDAMDEARFDKEVRPMWAGADQVPEWTDWESVRLYVGECVTAQLKHLDVHRRARMAP